MPRWSLRRREAASEAPPVSHDDDPDTPASRLASQLALALDRSLEAVVVVDAHGEVVLRNAPAARFHEARHGDALAEQAIDELLGRALTGETIERELRLFGPPPEVLALRASPLRAHDQLLGAVVFVRDVSETRRVESVRRDFVANVSHELKTPIGALALLAETLAETDDPTVTAQLAERVVGEAERLHRIVDDLLDLSLIESEEARTREPVPVSTLVREAVDRVRAAARASDVPIHVDEPLVDAEVACDRRQLVSALVNLLDNAVKYSEDGGSLEVSVARGGGRVAIAVRDHGIGIPRRDQERIFERFYRVDRARSRQTGGTGLGLSIVRHVAHAHGGDVAVESVEGEGSTFTLTVPVADAHEAGRAEAAG